MSTAPQPYLGNLAWALSRPPVSTRFEPTESGPSLPVDDDALITRVSAAYRKAIAANVAAGDGWSAWSDTLKASVHDALLAGGDAAQDALRHPERNTHFWGFDAICQAPPDAVEPHENVFRLLASDLDWRVSYVLWLHDTLISLADAVGALRVHYPETEPGLHYRIHGEPSDLDALLARIEAAIGMPLDFPNPYEGELGISTRRGIIGFRSLQAIYQAWRVKQLVRGRPDARILEVGAGLGRTAYYAHRLGLRDYTVIDIPLTGAAQGYFLGRTLGQETVALFGEEGAYGQVKVLPPESLTALSGRYDLILNVDSFTELSPPVTQTYWEFAQANADYLLSINHELNPHTVRELYHANRATKVSRHPYWMRRGYVEELVDFR